MSKEDVQRLVKEPFSCSIPLILTIKTCNHALEDLFNICKKLKPFYIDLDFTLFDHYQSKLQKLTPQSRLIVSKHSSQTYDILSFYKKSYRADVKKLVIETNDTYTGLKIAKIAQKKGWVLFAAGEKNTFTRFFSSWHYCYLHHPTGRGQLSYKELSSIYQKKFQIKIFYALVGSPVTHSLSHITHNQLLKTLSDAIYLKIDLSPYRLGHKLSLLKSLGAKGLSVTTPLKKEIPHLFKKSTQKKQSINTIDFVHKKTLNTDSLAFKIILQEIGVKNHILLLGNGACAQAFKHVLKTEGLVYDHWSRKEPIALKNQYNLVINATSSDSPLTALPSSKFLINIYHRTSHPRIESLAKAQSTSVITAKEFFYLQAIEQFKLWFDGTKQISQKNFFSLVKETLER